MSYHEGSWGRGQDWTGFPRILAAHTRHELPIHLHLVGKIHWGWWNLLFRKWENVFLVILNYLQHQCHLAVIWVIYSISAIYSILAHGMGSLDPAPLDVLAAHSTTEPPRPHSQMGRICSVRWTSHSRSRDQNTVPWFVKTGHVTWILACDWLLRSDPGLSGWCGSSGDIGVKSVTCGRDIGASMGIM